MQLDDRTRARLFTAVLMLVAHRACAVGYRDSSGSKVVFFSASAGLFLFLFRQTQAPRSLQAATREMEVGVDRLRFETTCGYSH